LRARAHFTTAESIPLNRASTNKEKFANSTVETAKLQAYFSRKHTVLQIPKTGNHSLDKTFLEPEQCKAATLDNISNRPAFSTDYKIGKINAELQTYLERNSKLRPQQTKQIQLANAKTTMDHRPKVALIELIYALHVKECCERRGIRTKGNHRLLKPCWSRFGTMNSTVLF
jgi:hypothetical protein